VSQQSAEERYVADIVVVSCVIYHALLGTWV